VVPGRTGCLGGGLGTIRVSVAQQYTERNGNKKLAIEFRPRIFGAYSFQDTFANTAGNHWGPPPGNLFQQVKRYESAPTSKPNPWWVRSYRYQMNTVDQVYRVEARLAYYKRTLKVWRRVHRSGRVTIATCRTPYD